MALSAQARRQLAYATKDQGAANEIGDAIDNATANVQDVDGNLEFTGDNTHSGDEAFSGDIGFFGAEVTSQPASADQAAVTPTTDIDGEDSVDAAVVLAAIQALETLINQLRDNLVTLGLIKGSA